MKPDRMILVCGKNCMPCRQLESWLNENNLEIDHIFGEDDLDFCRKYQLRQTPSLVLIEDPKEGISTYEAYQVISGYDAIKEYLESIYCL